MTEPPTPSADTLLVRAIGVRALAASTVNGIVGVGFYVLPATMAALLGPAAILAYLACALAAGLAALCIAECGSRVSASGGTYAYIEAAFGPFVGFLAGMVFWFGAQAGGGAAVSALVADTVVSLLPGSLAAGRGVVRAALIVGIYGGFALANVRSVRVGARLVEALTAIKLLPLLVLFAVGVFVVRPENLPWPRVPSWDAFGEAALVLFYAFVGAEGAVTASGEVRDPARTVPRALVIGLAVTTALYAGVHLVAQGVLGADLARETGAPLAVLGARVLGPWAGAAVLAAVTVSGVGGVAGDVLATPRILFAFARDGFLPARVAAVHPRFRTPHVAIWLHAAVVCTLALTGTFRPLAVLTVVATLLVYLACALAVLALRRRGVRGAGTPFVLWGGATVPLLTVATVGWLLSHAARAEWVAAAAALAGAALLYMGRRAPLGTHPAVAASAPGK